MLLKVNADLWLADKPYLPTIDLFLCFVKAAFQDTDIDTDTDILARILARMLARDGR